MAITLNASTSSGLVQTADTSGVIELQNNGTTKLTVSSSGVNIGQYNPSLSLITSGTTVASTSGTFIDFTGIPSWVKRITIMFNLVSSNGGSHFLIRPGTSSGIETTGYMSNSGYIPGAGGTGNVTNGFVIYHDTVASTTNGIITLATLGSNIWVASGTVAQSHGYTLLMAGSKTALAGSLDRVRILTANGTDSFNGGSINILYE